MSNIYGRLRLRDYFSISLLQEMTRKYQLLFPVTNLENFHKYYLEMIGKGSRAKAFNNNWLTKWILVDKYFRG